MNAVLKTSRRLLLSNIVRFTFPNKAVSWCTLFTLKVFFYYVTITFALRAKVVSVPKKNLDFPIPNLISDGP